MSKKIEPQVLFEEIQYVIQSFSYMYTGTQHIVVEGRNRSTTSDSVFRDKTHTFIVHVNITGVHKHSNGIDADKDITTDLHYFIISSFSSHLLSLSPPSVVSRGPRSSPVSPECG